MQCGLSREQEPCIVALSTARRSRHILFTLLENKKWRASGFEPCQYHAVQGKESGNDMMAFSTVAKFKVKLKPGPVTGAINLLDLLASPRSIKQVE